MPHNLIREESIVVNSIVARIIHIDAIDSATAPGKDGIIVNRPVHGIEQRMPFDETFETLIN